MQVKKIVISILWILIFYTNANANLLFFDNFDEGTRPEWGNEVGSWQTQNGVYFPTILSPIPEAPFTYAISSVTSLNHLTDFIVELDLNSTAAGGLFLRSSDIRNGVLLTYAGEGNTFNGLYWHIMENGDLTPQSNRAEYPNLIDNDFHLRISVQGNTYQAFLDNNPEPITTFITDKYSAGKVALYQNNPHTYDNFSISSIPEPATLFLLGGGLLGFSLRRSSLKKY